jgi:hypothetical protein
VFRKRNSTLALCAWLAIVQGMQGCKRPYEPQPNLTLEQEISPQPPRVGPVTIALKLTDAAGAPVTGAFMKLEGNMSHAGMSPVFGETKEIEPGRYRATLDLSMAGDWFVLVTVTLSDNRKLERQFEIKGVVPS